MDNDFSVDLQELATTIATNDVVVMRFVTVDKRLLLDFRSSDIDGPMVRLVEPVKSARERYATLQRLRPRFVPPKHIVAVGWPRFARSLDGSEAHAAIMERLVEGGHVEALRDARRTFADLAARETAHQKRAVRGGQGFRTLWSAAAKQP